MKKIIPFKKQIYLKNNIWEITSISLEHTLMPTGENMIQGEFIISGDYKMTENSINTDPFEFKLPCDIELHEKYKLDKVQINIDDFYYEIIDSSILEVNIDVLLDKLEEEELINEIPIKYVNIEELESDLKDNDDNDNRIDLALEEVDNKQEEKVECEMKEEVKERCIETEEYTKSIFSNFSVEEEYRTYKVYIVREGDSLEQIMNKYQINREELEKYNDLKDLSVGDKIIIPYFYENNK